jgi:hypothetical protein
MQLVDGVPLYEWAARRNPSEAQVAGLLAHVARALEATHGVGGLHRDVKGDNVLVRGADSWAFLTDFGAGHFRGAATLTSKLLPPGTPVYRSPEALAFVRAFLAASRRALRLQRWGRYLVVLSVMLALAAIYGGLRLQAYLADEQFVAEQLAAARKALALSQELRAQAREHRKAALKLFDAPSGPSSNPGAAPGAHELWEAANQRWSETLSLYGEANKAAAHATLSLERAIERAHGHREARRLLTELTYKRLLLAEAFHQKRDRDELRARLELMIDATEDGAKWRERIQAKAEFDAHRSPCPCSSRAAAASSSASRSPAPCPRAMSTSRPAASSWAAMIRRR